METTRRLLQRNTRDGKIGGVAAGLADYFGIDPTIVRLAFVLLVVAGGFGILAYLVAWLVMPAGDGSASPIRSRSQRDDRWILGLVILVAGLAALAGTIGFWWIDDFEIWPFALIAAGVALILWRRDDRDPPDPGPPPPDEAPTVGPLGPEEGPPGEDATTRVLAVPPSEPIAAPRRRLVPVGWITLGIIAIAAVIASILDATDVLDVPARWFLVGALGVAAIGIVAASLLGKVTGPVVLTVALALALPFVWAADVPLQWSAGDRTLRPTSTAELEDVYRLGAGELLLDLRQLDLAGQTRHVEASVSAGKLVVLVPPDAATEVNGHASVGEVELFDETENGLGIERSAETSTIVGSTDRLVLDLDVGIGRVDVRY